MAIQTAQIEWNDQHTPISVRYGDRYFSRIDGLAESRHVFLHGNDLPARFRPGFHIAELGFGTGLNMLAAWQAWIHSGKGGALTFTSFETSPMSPTDMQRALLGFADIADLAREFLALYSTASQNVRLPGLNLNIVPGDARQTLPQWPHTADAWYLDGFSPAKNPELWTADLMAQVADHTTPGGTFATYTAAGQVRRDLAEAGFTVRRVSGYGCKRHMSIGQLCSAKQRP